MLNFDKDRFLRIQSGAIALGAAGAHRDGRQISLAVGVRENYHLGFDVLLYFLPKGSKKFLRTISDLVVLSFAIGMIVYGITRLG